MFEILPEEIILEICSHLEMISRLRFASSSKRLWSIRNKLMVSETDYWKAGIIDEQHILGGIYLAIEINDFELLDFLVKKSENKWNVALSRAAYFGRKHFIEYLVKKGADDWNAGMIGASQGGHDDLISWFLEKGANNWDECLFAAAQNNRLHLLDFFIEKGAQKLEQAMVAAIYANNKHCVEHLISKGCHNWDEGIKAAAGTGNVELVEFFISKDEENVGGNHFGYFCAMKEAAQNGHLEVLQKLLAMVLHSDNLNYGSLILLHTAMACAARGGHKHITDYLIQRGATNWNSGLVNAVLSGNIELVKFFIEKGADDWTVALKNACQVDNTEIAALILDKSPAWRPAFRFVISMQMYHMVDLFLEKGCSLKVMIADTENSSHSEEFLQYLMDKQSKMNS